MMPSVAVPVLGVVILEAAMTVVGDISEVM